MKFVLKTTAELEAEAAAALQANPSVGSEIPPPLPPSELPNSDHRSVPSRGYRKRRRSPSPEDKQRRVLSAPRGSQPSGSQPSAPRLRFANPARIAVGLHNLSREDMEVQHHEKIAPSMQKRLDQCQIVYEALAQDTEWSHLVPTMQATFGRPDSSLNLAEMKVIVLYYVVSAQGRIGSVTATKGERLVTRTAVTSFVRALVTWYQRTFSKARRSNELLAQLLEYAASLDLKTALETALST